MAPRRMRTAGDHKDELEGVILVRTLARGTKLFVIFTDGHVTQIASIYWKRSGPSCKIQSKAAITTSNHPMTPSAVLRGCQVVSFPSRGEERAGCVCGCGWVRGGGGLLLYNEISQNAPGG